MVPVFLYQIWKWLKSWWTGEEIKDEEVKAPSGCPMASKAQIPEGMTECPVSKSKKVRKNLT